MGHIAPHAVRRLLTPRPGARATALLATGCLVAAVTACTGGQGDGTAGRPVGTGDTFEATIRRTSAGVPHITGDSLGDVAFGQGWASGEDRACDLADQIVKIRGERARWFGAGEDDTNLSSDIAWRAIGIVDRASDDWEDASDAVVELITGFAAGWNAHLAEVGADGLAGWCAGAGWVRPLEPVEVYAYERSIALLASSGQLVDYIASAQPPGAALPTTDEAAVGETEADGAAAGDEPADSASGGNRFTAYRLELVPGSPTTYAYGDWQREMTSRDVTVDVRRDDGSVEAVVRTVWSSHYGPIIDFPGFGWTEQAALTYRDANIDNDELADHDLGMLAADDLADVVEVHERVNGVPLFNTVAVSDDGRAWYADTSATPNLSDEAIAGYRATLVSDPVVQIAADNQVVLLDGSDPTYEWVEEEGARDPGLVPAAEQPAVERDDYVFNANGSFWLPHASEVLEGDYSPLHGAQRTAPSPRTRENAVVLRDTTPTGPAGADGAFTLDELADAALQNRGYTSRALLEPVVERYRGATTPSIFSVPPIQIAVPAQEPTADGAAAPAPLPAATIDVGPACRVLGRWDGVYDLDRVGPPIWRELMAQYERADMTTAGALWAEPFDPARPVDTPAGLAPAPGGGAPDPVLVNLARAVQSLDAAGFAVDATLDEMQFALRDGERIPMHGGDDYGTTNVVGWVPGADASILDPALAEIAYEPLVPGSTLARLDGMAGYPVNVGTSFLLALAFTEDGPQARAFLAYGDTEDRTSDTCSAATEALSAKAWREVAFTDEAIEADLVSETVVSG